jgi:hypothetical protein
MTTPTQSSPSSSSSSSSSSHLLLSADDANFIKVLAIRERYAEQMYNHMQVVYSNATEAFKLQPDMSDEIDSLPGRPSVYDRSAMGE